MTKILCLIATDRFSSPARLLVQNYEHRQREQFDMILACTWLGEDNELIQELYVRGVPLLRLSQRFGFDPAAVLSAYRLMLREKIDLIESHGYKPCAIGYLLKLLTGKPWVTVLHGNTAENKKMSLYSAIEFKLAKSADRIVTVSHEMRQRLVAKGLPADKTITIHNAIDPGQFSKKTLVQREFFGVTKAETLIGVIGRLSPEKGQDLFVKAFNLLAAEAPQVKALLIGEGPTEPALRELVKARGLEKRIIFAGYQPNIADFYPLLDMVVLPSRSEGLPGVLLEAFSFRIPVIATRVGGVPEVLIDGESGLLIPPEDPLALAVAIKKLLYSPELVQEFVVSAEALIQRCFLPATRADAFARLYEELVTNR